MSSAPQSATSIGTRRRSAARQQGAPSFFDRWLVRRILAHSGTPPLRIALWSGEEFGAGSDEAVVTIRLLDRSTLFGLVRRPELEFGEGYTRGSLVVEGDLLRLLDAIYEAGAGLPPDRAVRRRGRANTLRESRSNIHHHYDLGNEFYSWWLGETMAYTCAYFPEPDATLERAQLAKMDLVGRKLHLRPGESVIEAGCGWGGLALHLARRFGVRVRAFNISHQQILWAREQAERAGLTDQVEFVEDDYRNIEGQCDAFVSVGMLEHVGRENYRALGRVIDRVLSPSGRGLIHTIGRTYPIPLNPWIERHIFPGAYVPTLREMTDIFEPTGLSVLDVENLRPHYARTLEHWLSRYEQSLEKVRQRYDERFARAWRLYLSGSIAAFRSRSLQLFQVVFCRHGHDEPWTRGGVLDGLGAEPDRAAL